MPDNDRTYKVIAIDPDGPIVEEAEPDGTAPRQRYIDLGTFPGHDAEAACKVAADKSPLPDGTASLVAIPSGNWNECDLEEDPRPRYRATRRK